MCEKCKHIVSRKREIVKRFYNETFEPCGNPVKWEVQYAGMNGRLMSKKMVCGYHRQYIKKKMEKFNLPYFEIKLL